MAKVKIYVKDNCLESAKALDIASWLKNFAPSLDIDLINLTTDNVPDEVKGADGPVYEIGGHYFEGNPGPAQIKQILKSIATKNVN